jgi:hypothetical protein
VVATGVLVFCALLACKKVGIEAKATGYKAGSNTVVVVHVKSSKNTRVSCGSGGLSCSAVDTNYAGEADLEVDLEGENSGQTQKVVALEAGGGSTKATLMLDLGASGLPPKVDVNSAGTIACVARKCSGTLTFAPAGRLELEVETGTSVELGSETFTVKDGKLDTTVHVATQPPLAELPVESLCAKETKPLGSTTLTLTFPDKVKVSTSIELDTDQVLKPVKEALAAIDKGPVLFPWESGKASAPKKRGVAVYMSRVLCSTSGPTDATLADVSVVAVSTGQTREDTCAYQLTEQGSGTSRGTATGKLTIYDENATAYNRGSGAKLGTRLFKATKHCRADMDLTSTTIPDQGNFVSAPAVAKWAGSLAR